MRIFLRTSTGIFLYFAFLLSSFSGSAQQMNTEENTFSLSGQFRPRLEYRDGYTSPLSKGQKPAALISERLRMTLDYSYKNLLSFRISPQNVGIWGQESLTQATGTGGNTLAFFEAWSSLQLSPSWDLRVGRQVISLDDERLFGQADWVQGALAHDALSLHYQKNDFAVKGFFAFNQNYKENYGNNINNPSGTLFTSNQASPYKWMQTVWSRFPLSENSKLSLLLSNVGFQEAETADPAKTYFLQTMGGHFSHGGAYLELTLSGYYQTGKTISGKNTNAYLAAAYVGYKSGNVWSLGVGSDLLSGNDVGTANVKNRRFNPLFQTGHKFYGHMDYFNTGAAFKNAGLSDTYIRSGVSLPSNVLLNLALHQFISPNTVRETDIKYSSNMGQEADLSLSLKINDFADLSGGYSLFLTSRTTTYLKDNPQAQKSQHWGWLTLDIHPTFFKTKW